MRDELETESASLIFDCREDENLWAISMQWVAKREKLTGTYFKPLTGGALKKTPARMTGPESVAMVRILAERNASTIELAEAVGLHPNPASWRLRGLWRGRYVDMVGTAPSTGQGVQTVWALGPRGNEWLERYGVSNG